MPGAFRSPSDLLAVKYRAGESDYTDRATTHYETAQDIHAQRTTRVAGELSFVTKWANPQDLRLWAHEHELAQECLTASHKCRAHWWTASNKAHQHALFCEARNAGAPRSNIELAPSLREIATKRAGAPRSRSANAPPGAPRLSALATCHASNAPGLSLLTHALTETGT